MNRLPAWPFPWRPRRPHVVAGAATLFVLALALALTTPWSSGGDSEPDGVSATATRTSRPSRTRAPTTPTAVPPPTTPTATAAPPAPTAATNPTPPPAPVARLAQLIPWSGADPRVVELAMFPGSSDEAIVVTQKDAAIWKVSLSGAFAPVLLADISDPVGPFGNEEGLLSAAFSPQFQSDGRVYVYYTKKSNVPTATVLSRFQFANGVIDTGSEAVILEVPDFAENHNGGRIAFGKDGFLYLSTGDGGGGGDPDENGQNPNTP